MNNFINNLINEIATLKGNFNSKINEVSNLKNLEEVRIEFLGKKSQLNQFFSNFKNCSEEEKKQAGYLINNLRDEFNNQMLNLKSQIENRLINQKLLEEKLDLTLPSIAKSQGFIHVLNKTMKDIREIFCKIGFDFAEGNEIEDDFHNFTALNIPAHHPARQMQDSFYLQNSEKLLRTHTSNVQIRQMMNNKPPFRICALGRVFRCDSDQTHTPMFHQLEGFVVDKNINFGNLKWCLEHFLSEFFEVDNLEIRMRPSFFPFTEPSAEVDIGYKIENGAIKIGKSEKFLEILGCGMIHPQVFTNCGIDNEEYQGFAFGIGIERLAMLKYGITDLRMLFENNLQFLNHYGFKFYQF